MGYDVKINPMFIRLLYRKLIVSGYTPQEAGNLIAKLIGLAATEKGWTTKELVDMMFLDHIKDTVPP